MIVVAVHFYTFCVFETLLKGSEMIFYVEALGHTSYLLVWANTIR